ncbi:hypothetical protein HY620_01470 [Candidatus Uhrbacteria bacterium]|nr:hypothetical protein [Candidatus Uhrbacteria bacterium]
MISIQKTNVVLLPLTHVALMILALAFPQFFFWFLGAAAVFTDILVGMMLPKNHSRSALFVAAWPPFILILSTFGLLFIVEYDFLKHAILGLNALMQFLYALNLYYFYYRSQDYQRRSFLHMNSLMQTLSFFSVSSVAFGLHYYAVAHPFFIFAPYISAICIFVLHSFLLHEQPIKAQRLVIASMCLLLVESSFALHLLPSMYYMNAYIITLVYVIILQLLMSSLRNELTRSQITTSVLLALGMLLLLVIVQFWK